MTATVVGDLVTVRGLGFAGIDGIVVENAEEARDAIRRLLDMPDIGLILVAQTFVEELGDEFDAYKVRKHLPLVLNIPDSFGAGKKADDIQALVQKALGLRI
jgi:V/A-type H+-transporting ATPase subunit F